MGYGYTGKILEVNLSNGKQQIHEKGDGFYRKYLGGFGIAAYFALTEIEPRIDPLSPENVMIFAAGTLTGTTAPAVPRYTVCAKSPLTNAIGKSDAGGFWGPELKKAGYDAIIVKGKSPNPVYLKIDDDVCEIKDAADLWGQDTLAAQTKITEIEGKGHRVLQIGQAGENQVLMANIVNELGHFNGRNGLGAVMGSKKLKAIVVKGKQKVPCVDDQLAPTLTKWVAKNLEDYALAYGLYLHGTAGGVTGVNANGALPTNNWQLSHIEDAEKIGAESLEEILVQRKGCFSCPIRCKRVVEHKEEPYVIESALGGPEFETLILLGSNLGITNIKLVTKANELCNRYTIDTMSLGMTISFAMECYEKGIITKEDTGGLELTFGNESILLDLITMTAFKKGFGKELALGSYRLAEKWGKGSEKFLLHAKKQEFPAHDPRVRGGMAIQYALSSSGADHWFAQHDPFYAEKGSPGMKSVSLLGITEPVAIEDYSPRKAKVIYYTHMLNMLYDCLGVCSFGYASRSMVSIEKLVELVNAVTGWDMGMWELLKAGERSSLMLRVFNQREGFSSADDVLPERVFEPIGNGPRKGAKLSEKKFLESRNAFYQMAGYDEEGRPTEGKLVELDLRWVFENKGSDEAVMVNKNE